MIKKLLPYAKEYKWYTILAPLFIVCEVILEVVFLVLWLI